MATLKGLAVATLPERLRLAIVETAALLHWRDGRETAQGIARGQKRCESAFFDSSDQALNDEVGAAIQSELFHFLRSPALRDFALPAVFAGLRLVRYRVGDYYDWHTDEVLSAHGFRADLSFTIMLTPAIMGGGLVVGNECPVLSRGDCYVYPSTTAHKVCEVREGERLVLVGWIQSQVRDHSQRALLAELHRMASNPKEVEAWNIQAVRNELLRCWSA